MAGKLLIISTPIGNLGDLTARVKDAFETCDFVLAEDTRVTIKLLNHLGVSKRLVSCHDCNEWERLSLLDDAASSHKTVALASDAGTPLISDPGLAVVRRAISLGMEIVPIPGPSAFTLALVGSGLPCDRFCFEGFLPDKRGAMLERLANLKDENRTMIFYVSAGKLQKTLELMMNVLGDRPVCLARELTKMHEEFVRSTIAALKEELSTRVVRGECVLVVGGNTGSAQQSVDAGHVERAVIQELKSGMHIKDIAAILSREFGWKKSDIYRIAVKHRDEH